MLRVIGNRVAGTFLNQIFSFHDTFPNPGGSRGRSIGGEKIRSTKIFSRKNFDPKSLGV